MSKTHVGLFGFGNVGSGVVKILREKRNLLAQRLGVDVDIKKICDKDITSKRTVAVDKGLLTKNPKEIIDDPHIDIVIELMGGIHPAKEYIIESLKKGKHVVTANKALLAQDGQELFALAQDRGKNIYFEASVGAGIPIIKSLREGLVANRFNSIFGILNGTSNFILSQMSESRCSFAAAMSQAKLKGFAEKDPTLDIEGIDSAHKLILLTYLCFGKWVGMQDVFVEGISRISLADVEYASELNLQIKLLAIAKKEHEGLEVRVHPTLIPRSHLLASVNSMFNAIYVESDLAGKLLFYGPGAGQLSAASAVVADVVDLTHDIRAGLFRPTLHSLPDTSVLKIRKIDDFESRYYIRFMALDKPGVLAQISGVLAKFGISIASVTQKERSKAQVVPIVMVLHQAKEKNLRLALSAISRISAIKEEAVAIRIEEV